MSGPISIKLRCTSWAQLASIYKRDLSRQSIFLRSGNPPPLGTPVRIDLTLPSESMVVLNGAIARHIRDGETDPQLAGRGAGVDVKLSSIPQSALWLIETALASAAAQKEAATKQARPPTQSLTPATQSLASLEAGRDPARDRDVSREARLGDGSDLADAETELLVALTSELDSLRKLNPFQVLGLGYEANDADVRAAFGELTKRYHPDRYARYQSTDLRSLAAEIFILIRDAYRKLGDETSRGQVLVSLGRRPVVSVPPVAPSGGPAYPRPGTPPPAPGSAMRPAVPSPPMSSANPGRAMTPAAGVRTTGASAAAMPLSTGPLPSNGGDLAIAESMLDGGKYDEALAMFKIAIRKNPTDRAAKAGIELAEGMRALAARDRLEAAQRFEAALELDPANERAARELAEMRRLATNERKGMLSRLLGKKE